MEHVEHSLPDLLFGLLDEDENVRVRQHLEQCGTCRASLKELEEGLVAFPPKADVRPSPTYFSTVLPRTRSRVSLPQLRRSIAWPVIERIVLPLGAAAVMILAILSIDSTTSTSSQGDGHIKPLLSSFTQEDIRQWDEAAQNTETISEQFSAFFVEQELRQSKGVPAGILNEALTSGEVDDAVTGMVEVLEEEELQTVMQQLAERTSVL